MTKSVETTDLVTFIEEILNGKLHFLCRERLQNSSNRDPLNFSGICFVFCKTSINTYISVFLTVSRLGDDYFNTDGGEATPEIQIRRRRSSSCSSDTRENYQKPESPKYGNGSDLTLSNIDNEVNSRLVTLQISKTSLMLFSVGSKTLLLEKKINNISFCTKVCNTAQKRKFFHEGFLQ